ncbi:Annexin [Ancylostoma duodenale]|nr:Annexin [Ancylostoma duodenale]
MKVGLGTRDNDLIRVLVTRSEVDLELIKQEFQALYNKPLDDMIKGDTSGQYRDALLAIVVGNRM